MAVISNGTSTTRLFQNVRSKEGISPGSMKMKRNGRAKPNLTQATTKASDSFNAFLHKASVVERQKAASRE